MRRTTKKERKENANRFYSMFMNSNYNQKRILEKSRNSNFIFKIGGQNHGRIKRIFIRTGYMGKRS